MCVFPAAVGNVVIGASGQEQYRKFCIALGAEHLLRNERFATAEARTRNVDAFTEAASVETRKHAMAELVDLLNRAGIACGPINGIDRVFADPQVQASGIVRPLQHPRLGMLNLLSSPIIMSGAEPIMERPAPEKGEHTEEVLREFGFTGDEVARLRADRIAI
jgi:formyl-CoA transferase